MMLHIATWCVLAGIVGLGWTAGVPNNEQFANKPDGPGNQPAPAATGIDPNRVVISPNTDSTVQNPAEVQGYLSSAKSLPPAANFLDGLRSDYLFGGFGPQQRSPFGAYHPQVVGYPHPPTTYPSVYPQYHPAQAAGYPVYYPNWDISPGSFGPQLVYSSYPVVGSNPAEPLGSNTVQPNPQGATKPSPGVSQVAEDGAALPNKASPNSNTSPATTPMASQMTNPAEKVEQ